MIVEHIVPCRGVALLGSGSVCLLSWLVAPQGVPLSYQVYVQRARDCRHNVTFLFFFGSKFRLDNSGAVINRLDYGSPQTTIPAFAHSPPPIFSSSVFISPNMVRALYQEAAAATTTKAAAPPSTNGDAAAATATCRPEHGFHAFDALYCALTRTQPIKPAFADDKLCAPASLPTSVPPLNPQSLFSSPLFVTWNTRRYSAGGNGGWSTRLRGCIGTFDAQPLRTALKEYALLSAFRDHRFQRIELRELPALECGCVPPMRNAHFSSHLPLPNLIVIFPSFPFFYFLG